MKHPAALGEVRTRLDLKHAELDRQNAETLVRIAAETDAVLERPSFGTPPGDERKLRGIPVVGGCTGAIGGTIPHVHGVPD